MDEEKIVLLIEDNPNDEALTIRALQKNNLKNKIVVARDGAEALEYLFGTGKHAGRDMNIPPVIILLDLNLPKVNGLEVLRQLRSDPKMRSIPVAVLTSSNQDRDIVEGYNLNVNSFVRKPVDMQEFSQAVRQLGLYWLLLNEPPPVNELAKLAEQ